MISREGSGYVIVLPPPSPLVPAAFSVLCRRRGPAPPRRHQRLLIIDDSKSIHTLVAARLWHEPLEIHSAYDGESGLAMARARGAGFDPTGRGHAPARRLRGLPATQGRPGHYRPSRSSSSPASLSTEEKIRGLELGAVDYVTKPFDAAELRARVRACLRTKFLLDLLAKRAMVDGLTGLWNRGPTWTTAWCKKCRWPADEPAAFVRAGRCGPLQVD